MNARKKQPRQPQGEDASLKRALFKSTLFHIALFLFTLIGIPLISKPPVVLTPVSVELVNISDVSRTTKVAQPKKEPEKPQEIEAPKPPEEKIKPPPKSVPEQPPEIPDPVIPEPPKPEEKKPDPKPKPPEPKKEEKKKPKPKPPEPKKEEPKKQEEDFDSLLKNLAPEEKEPPSKDELDKPPEKDAEAPSGALAELGAEMSISELDALRYQIAPCWNIPAGAEFAENLAVEIRVMMNRDGTVQDASVLDKGRYNRDNAYRAAADSAMRALRNPQCSPLKLPPDKYNTWKQFVINFDPRDML
jgi:hypothetical protein